MRLACVQPAKHGHPPGRAHGLQRIQVLAMHRYERHAPAEIRFGVVIELLCLFCEQRQLFDVAIISLIGQTGLIIACKAMVGKLRIAPDRGHFRSPWRGRARQRSKRGRRHQYRRAFLPANYLPPAIDLGQRINAIEIWVRDRRCAYAQVYFGCTGVAHHLEILTDVVPRTIESSIKITRLPSTCTRLALCLSFTEKARMDCCGSIKVRPT